VSTNTCVGLTPTFILQRNGKGLMSDHSYGEEQYGQKCGSCNQGQVLQPRIFVDKDGSSTTTLESGLCGQCDGTGWLSGRVR